jgi:fatty-acyl-CoA synthase
MNLADWIEHHAAFTPDKPAVVAEGRSCSYAELAADIARAAAALAAAGVAPGDRVAVLAYNRSETLALLFACARLGALLAPFNWRLAPPEHAQLLADCAPRILVVEGPFVEPTAAIVAERSGVQCVALDADAPAGWRSWRAFVAGGAGRVGVPSAAAVTTPSGASASTATASTATASAATTATKAPLTAARVPGARGGAADLDAPLLLCYTSGSTGRPKGVVLSQRALFFNAVNSAHMHELTARDTILTTLPLFHVGGLNILSLPALHAGATLILHPRFDPAAALDALEGDAVTLTVLVPAQLDAMVAHPRWPSADLSRLRCITTGSTIIAEAYVRRFHARGVPLIQVYGSTETCPIASYVPIADATRKPGSVGKAALHCELRLVDESGREPATGAPGEIQVRGPSVLDGYWSKPEETAAAFADGWYRSGDVGHFDDEGFLYVDGRQRDVIITGGENVYPAEIENVLAESPKVAEVAVIGRPDPRWGDAVVAIVAPAAGVELTADEVIGLLQGRIARYKHPREVVFVPALPRTALGKVRREALRDLVRREPAIG